MKKRLRKKLHKKAECARRQFSDNIIFAGGKFYNSMFSGSLARDMDNRKSPDVSIRFANRYKKPDFL